MRVQLKKNYVLTNEQSSNGEPVLMNTETGEKYGPMDVFEPSHSYGTMLCRAAVKKMVRGKNFTDEEQTFIKQFVGLLNGG